MPTKRTWLQAFYPGCRRFVFASTVVHVGLFSVYRDADAAGVNPALPFKMIEPDREDARFPHESRQEVDDADVDMETTENEEDFDMPVGNGCGLPVPEYPGQEIEVAGVIYTFIDLSNGQWSSGEPVPIFDSVDECKGFAGWVRDPMG